MFVPCAGKICIKLFIIIFCLNKNNKCFYKCKYVIIIKFLILFPVGPPYTLHFRVRFYAAEPQDLTEELTR